jgi:hypothetical protein
MGLARFRKFPTTRDLVIRNLLCFQRVTSGARIAYATGQDVRSSEHAGASRGSIVARPCPESAPPGVAISFNGVLLLPPTRGGSSFASVELDGHSLVSRKTRMLRIERSVKGALVVFTVSGRVGVEHIPELRRVLDSEADNKKALDLKDVRLVDRDAVRLLARCEADGTALENCPTYIREWIVRERDLK